MLPDQFVSITIAYDTQSADLVAVYTGPDKVSGMKEWTTRTVAAHTDNEWHVIRDMLIDWIGEQF